MMVGVYSFDSFPRPVFGQTVRMMNILKYLSKSNKVTVYCPVHMDVDEESGLSANKFPSVTIKNFGFSLSYRHIPFGDLKVHRFLKHEYRNGNFDVLQIENPYGVFFLAKNCSFPKVAVFHGREIEELSYGARNRLLQKKIKTYFAIQLLRSYVSICEKMLVRKSNYVVATSELVKKYAVKLGADPASVIVAKNGIDLKEFQEYSRSISRRRLRKKLGIPEDSFVFIFHGSLHYSQNQEAIKNIIKIRNELENHKLEKNYYFLIVGGPKRVLKEFLNLSSDINNVLFTGYVEDVKPYLFSANCGIAPFPEDVKPGGPRLKILEFLAAGLPVITTETGISGFEELVNDQPIYLIKEGFENLKDLLPLPQCKVKKEKLERYDWAKVATINEEVLRRAYESFRC